MEAVFIMNPGFEQEITKISEVREAQRDVAERIADGVRNNVHGATGQYEASVTVQPYGRSFVRGYRVFLSAPYASFLEFGSRFQRAQYPVRNAVEALGLKFKKRRG